ncbi:MAG: L,D-transpeptidase family protein [Actinobacteria bacterium]|nr:L,D-transpeptidase family protein [Actinomycetota bacterium]
MNIKKIFLPLWLILILWLALLPTVANGETEKIAIGSEGKDVYEIEKRLTRLSFNPGKVDEIYDIKTKFAIRTFQSVNGIIPTGVVDEETLKKLENPKKLQVENKYIKDLIEVNLTRQILVLVSGGKIKYILPVSSGKKGYDTPTGYYFVNGLWPGWHDVVNKPWTGKMYNSIYFWGSYAIHGSTSVPPYPASHGCIRITYWDADLIFPLVYRWEQIIIYK